MEITPFAVRTHRFNEKDKRVDSFPKDVEVNTFIIILWYDKIFIPSELKRSCIIKWDTSIDKAVKLVTLHLSVFATLCTTVISAEYVICFAYLISDLKTIIPLLIT